MRAGFFGFDEILSLEQNLVFQHCLSSTKLLQNTCDIVSKKLLVVKNEKLNHSSAEFDFWKCTFFIQRCRLLRRSKFVAQFYAFDDFDADVLLFNG